ncbi:MAG TPA: Mut7-C RNAse domain-containing protein [Patescibacteria group bacterium]|nr:Mut7-C RNAse domain-containing protein [Patescibacteria group bacterium]
MSRSRILKAYRTRFHQLLRQVGARRTEQGVNWLVARAKQISSRRETPLSAALTTTFEDLVSRPAFAPRKRPTPRRPDEIHFFCDSGLGGLARWLRGAGYDALWKPHIADDRLLELARQSSSTVLTTDSMLMERRVLRDKIIPSFWLPPTLSIPEQLERVFREFELCVNTPRCMSCGGPLVKTDKEALREQIPPKTYLWLNDYFVCARCGKLFWHGTHWKRIMGRLNALAGNCCTQ